MGLITNELQDGFSLFTWLKLFDSPGSTYNNTQMRGLTHALCDWVCHQYFGNLVSRVINYWELLEKGLFYENYLC
jgi:hypothetical protein